MSNTLVNNPPRTIKEVFENLPEGTLCEIINNKLIMAPAPFDIHQKLSMKLSSLLYNFITENNLGELRNAPYDVYFDDENIFQPDILFILQENIKKIKPRGFFGAPDIVIEILSPSSLLIDKNDKKWVYEANKVKEYFIINPEDNSVISYYLEGDQFLEMNSTPGLIHSKLIDHTFQF